VSTHTPGLAVSLTSLLTTRATPQDCSSQCTPPGKEGRKRSRRTTTALSDALSPSPSDHCSPKQLQGRTLRPHRRLHRRTAPQAIEYIYIYIYIYYIILYIGGGGVHQRLLGPGPGLRTVTAINHTAQGPDNSLRKDSATPVRISSSLTFCRSVLELRDGSGGVSRSERALASLDRNVGRRGTYNLAFMHYD
jgi:hypothetical protein